MTSKQTPAGGPAPTSRLRLRYAGTCRHCGLRVAAGATADYDRTARRIACLRCADGLLSSPGHAGERHPAPVSGTAGASARRQFEWRSSKRAARVRSPRLGGLLLALSTDPQSTRAWATGALGEARVGAVLDGLTRRGVRVLHDRRIPSSRANIDHLAVTPGGVYVIDAKRYKGRIRRRVRGGLLCPRRESLVVGGRDRSPLVAGVHRQVELVRDALHREPAYAGVPVRGVLCFVDGDWPVFSGSFTVDGVAVLTPRRVGPLLTRPGLLDDDEVRGVHWMLAREFPVA